MPRPKGSLNRPKRRLLQILEEQFPGWHPVVQLAEVANNPDNDLRTRTDAAREVAQYVTPKLKAIEIQGDTATSLSHLLLQLREIQLSSEQVIEGSMDAAVTLPEPDQALKQVN